MTARRAVCFWLLFAGLLALGWLADSPAIAQPEPEPNSDGPDLPPLEQRIADVAAQFRANPGDYDAIFAEAFLRAVPPRQLTAIFRQYVAQAGNVTATEIETRRNDFSADVLVRTDKDMQFGMKITIENAPPHKIIGLFISAPEPAATSVVELLRKFGELEGQASVAIYRWTDAAADAPAAPPTRIAGLNAAKALAIGSSFKLYILGALADEINAGRRRFDNVFELREEWKSLPSGEFHTWPAGSPLTLHTMAAKMISISDNTATDHLLHILGRERIEGQVARMGHATPALNQPFLATSDMFFLKEVGHAQRIADFLAGDTAARRAYLATMGRLDRDRFAGLNDTTPTAIDTIEWFASADDLCLAMHWLQQHTGENRPAHATREILSINPGMAISRAKWSYVGFKGGSEPGVLNLTWLLQARETGEWFAVSVGVNNPNAPVNDAAIVGMASALVRALAE